MKNIISYFLSLMAFHASAEELTTMDGAFGTGLHASFDPDGPENQIVSTLSKDGLTYSLERTREDSSIVKFTRKLGTQDSEKIVQFSKNWWIFNRHDSEIRIVDVFETETGISFLVAGDAGYVYFRVVKTSDFVIPSGHYNYAVVDMNSANWTIIQLLISPTDFGYGFSAWGHAMLIETIKFTDQNHIEVVTKNGLTELFEINANTIMKGGQQVAHVRFGNPSMATEAQIINSFSVDYLPTNKHVKVRVESKAGGKPHVLTLLDAFQDVAAANSIRTRIEQAYQE